MPSTPVTVTHPKLKGRKVTVPSKRSANALERAAGWKTDTTSTSTSTSTDSKGA